MRSLIARCRPSLPTTASLAVLAAMLALVLATAMTSPLKDDVAWLLYAARKWLAGGRLYEDIIEVNPPLIIWLYSLPSMAATWLGVGPKTTAAPFFAAILMGCALWTALLLRGPDRVLGRTVPVFAVIGTVLLALPGVEFGQREHLLIAAALPYLALFARGLDGERERTLPGAAVGLAAGLGCALKPSYLVAFLLLELVGKVMGSRLRRPATYAAAAVFVVYAGGVLVFCPEFLAKAVPLALALYGATDTPAWDIVMESRILLQGVAVVVLLAATLRIAFPAEARRPRALMITLAVFAVAATISYVLQGKNWFYHRLPATTATVLALLLWGATVAAYRAGTRRLLVPAALAAVALLELGVADYRRLKPWIEAAVEPELSTEVKLERLVKREKVRTYIAFSEWIALGFPVVNDTGVTWASRFDSMWALKGELWRARQDGSAPADYPVRRWVARDFIAACPDLAVVDTRSGINYVGVLAAADPAFAQAWAHYREIAEFDRLRVLKRDDTPCVPPKPELRPRMTVAAWPE